MDKTTRLDPENLAALLGTGERTPDSPRSANGDVTVLLGEATASLPAPPSDATLALSSSGAAEVTRALPPLVSTNATIVFKADAFDAAPEGKRTFSEPAAPISSAPITRGPRHAVVCTPPHGDLDRRVARRARAVAVLITRSDKKSITHFRVTPPDGPSAPPGLVLYPRRVRDSCIRVDIAWLPPYPAKPARGGKTAPLGESAFRVHVDGVTATIPVRLYSGARRGSPPARATAPESEVSEALPRSENACGTFLASELAAALDPPPDKDAPLPEKTPAAPSRARSWMRLGLIAGAAVAALGLLLFALSGNFSPQSSPYPANAGAPGLLVSARPDGGMGGAAPRAALAPPGFIATGIASRPGSQTASVAVINKVERWEELALWRVAGRNGATFPRVVVDTRKRAPWPGAALTRLVTRPVDLPAVLVLTGGLTLQPQGSAPLFLSGATGAARPPQGALLLGAASARPAAYPPLRPLRRADAGRFWVFRLSQPVPIGSNWYTRLLSPRPLRVLGSGSASAARLPAWLLSERGLTAWAPGDVPPPAARAIVPLPGFTMRVSVIEAAAFVAPAATPLR